MGDMIKVLCHDMCNFTYQWINNQKLILGYRRQVNSQEYNKNKETNYKQNRQKKYDRAKI